jgi:transaldolase
LKHYVDICNLVDGDVSAEVNALDYDGMIKEGEELADLHIDCCNDQRGCYGC